MNPLLLEGLADGIGFIGGALLGWGLASLLGFNIFDAGFGNASMIGIVLVGLGGGMGVQLARRWRASRKKVD